MNPLEELADQLENHGWDSELIDAAKARMAQLEKVAEVARRIRAETVLDLPHLDDDLTAVLAELDHHPETKE
jgi:hypothetical protein